MVDDQIDDPGRLVALQVVDVVEHQDERLDGIGDQFGQVVERRVLAGRDVDSELRAVGELRRDRLGEDQGVVVDRFEVEPASRTLVVGDPSPYLRRLAVSGGCQDAQDATVC